MSPRHVHEERWSLMSKKSKELTRDQVIDKAVEELMDVIDHHKLSSSDVPRLDSIDLLKGIIGACRMRVETIQQEMAND